jgi:AraC-like DNA-binding protein
MLVRSELEKLGLKHNIVELGEVEITGKLTAKKLEQLRIALNRSGLKLMDDKKAMLIEKIKNVIIEMVHYSEELPRKNFSDYLEEKLNQDYTHMSNIFSEVKGITIEHFIMLHKIEKVKELIIYDELNLSEIANKLHYSSVSHLSNQFKKITGLTPTFFKSLKNKRRTSLEDL